MRWFLGLALLTAGCAAPSDEDGGQARPLRVAAASDLQEALPELARRFEAASGVEVVPVFGASGILAAQIAQGAPFDLFLSADRGYVERLAREGILKADSIRPYARGELVLAVHAGAAVDLTELAGLRGPGIRSISLANPDFAPYGRAAREALRNAGLWDDLGPKLVQAESVRQALQFVRTGNADAGLVARSVALGGEVRIVAIDPALYSPLVQVLGIVEGSAQGALAEQFARFVLGEEGRSVLDAHGLKPPPEAPPNDPSRPPAGSIRDGLQKADTGALTRARDSLQ